MKEKYKRLKIVVAWIFTFSIGIVLMLFAIKDNIIYFVTPTQICHEPSSTVKVWRLGGVVSNIDILKNDHDYKYRFQVSDHQTSIRVDYKGVIPQLFRNKQGVVAEGYWLGEKKFQAQRLLIKHDETYRPPQLPPNFDNMKNSATN